MDKAKRSYARKPTLDPIQYRVVRRIINGKVRYVIVGRKGKEPVRRIIWEAYEANPISVVHPPEKESHQMVGATMSRTETCWLTRGMASAVLGVYLAHSHYDYVYDREFKYGSESYTKHLNESLSKPTNG